MKFITLSTLKLHACVVVNLLALSVAVFSSCSKETSLEKNLQPEEKNIPVITRNFNTIQEAQRYIATASTFADTLKASTFVDTLKLATSKIENKQLKMTTGNKSELTDTWHDRFGGEDGFRTWYLKFPGLAEGRYFPYLLTVNVAFQGTGTPLLGSMDLTFGEEYFPGLDYSVEPKNAYISGLRQQFTIYGFYIFIERVTVGSVVVYSKTWLAKVNVKYLHYTKIATAQVTFTPLN
ncbi:hypothetical protein [Sphingobacterium zeae]|uniref:Lipoprotein n=1 Tax=Sphingobacterium zeae TaxID=1776859 RepID=A0ABU0U2F6_9SPHI|nr:hypothetical protein [Sphingobacterium zeae]MDQ1149131.1 hypothetical protein [Sphingobacterium zeae]